MANKNILYNAKISINTSLSWTAMSGLISANYLGVTYGDGRFVCVGKNGKSYYSTDGLTWIAMSGLDSSYDYVDVTYGNGRFVCIGEDGGKSYYSTDGQTWTTMSGILSSEYMYGVTYGNGKFICVGDDGACYYSTDGINWTIIPQTGGVSRIRPRVMYNGVTYGNGKFVCVGDSGCTAYSLDGLTWTGNTQISDYETLSSVAYGNGRFICVGGGGKSYYSTNGTTWAAMTGLSSAYISYSVTYGNESFICVGSSNTSYYSLDGLSWNLISSQTGIIQSVVYGYNKFVCVGNGGSSYYLSNIYSGGYDTLYPLTPYVNHIATSVTGSGANYALTINLPVENIVSPITISFKPNVSNAASCTVSVNGLTAVALTSNGSVLASNELKTTSYYKIIYDPTNSTAEIVSPKGIKNLASISKYNAPASISETLIDGDIIPKTWISSTTAECTGTINGMGTVKATSEGAGGSYPLSNAFDGSTSTYWDTINPTSTTSGYVQLEFPQAIKITKMKLLIHPLRSGYFYVYGFRIKGSNDNATWVDLFSADPLHTTALTELTLTTSGYYKYYSIRFGILSNYDLGLYEWQVSQYAINCANFDADATSYENGMKFLVSLSSGIPVNQININGLGAKTINLPLTDGKYELAYNGSSFDVKKIFSTGSLTAGTSSLPTGTLYFVY